MFEVESSKISTDHDMLSTKSTLPNANVKQEVSHTDWVAEVITNDIQRLTYNAPSSGHCARSPTLVVFNLAAFLLLNKAGNVSYHDTEETDDDA